MDISQETTPIGSTQVSSSTFRTNCEWTLSTVQRRAASTFLVGSGLGLGLGLELGLGLGPKLGPGFGFGFGFGFKPKPIPGQMLVVIWDSELHNISPHAVSAVHTAEKE